MIFEIKDLHDWSRFAAPCDGQLVNRQEGGLEFLDAVIDQNLHLVAEPEKMTFGLKMFAFFCRPWCVPAKNLASG